jgi:hypothetical protein
MRNGSPWRRKPSDDVVRADMRELPFGSTEFGQGVRGGDRPGRTGES